MGIFSFFKRGLEKTTTSIFRGISSLFGKSTAWTDEDYKKLEATLIGTDLGVAVSREIVAKIRDLYERGKIATAADVSATAQSHLLEIIGSEPVRIHWAENGPTVLLMVGVNGSGKTTTCAKLAKYFQNAGKNVLLAAGDTFRAAGIEQLQIWGGRLNIPVIAGKHGGDAAALAFDATTAAKQRAADLLIIDTAGRQHTRADLMNELQKMQRVITKACPGAPHEIWLTVDASTGTNALLQAREFGKLFPITGLLLTKLDGTGKGGIAVAIRRELGYPVHFVGLGEQPDDLQPFAPAEYVKALFETDTPPSAP